MFNGTYIDIVVQKYGFLFKTVCFWGKQLWNYFL